MNVNSEKLLELLLSKDHHDEIHVSRSTMNELNMTEQELLDALLELEAMGLISFDNISRLREKKLGVCRASLTDKGISFF